MPTLDLSLVQTYGLNYVLYTLVTYEPWAAKANTLLSALRLCSSAINSLCIIIESSRNLITVASFKARIDPTYRAMGWIKAWEQVEGTSPELLKMYADTPNSLRCDGYLDRLAFWGQRESNKHNYL